MKSLLFLSLITSAQAFLQVALTKRTVQHSSSSLFFYPDNYDRAVECATHFGTCNLDELEQLANDLEDFQASETGGRIQGKDHYKDTLQVKEILEMQGKLKELTNDYINDHHKPDTFDMSEIF